jgi:hypothetical protein
VFQKLFKFEAEIRQNGVSKSIDLVKCEWENTNHEFSVLDKYSKDSLCLPKQDAFLKGSSKIRIVITRSSCLTKEN